MDKQTGVAEPDPQVSQGSPDAVALGIEELAGALVMAALVVITFVNVLVRYLTDSSFAWTEEISVFMLVALTLIGSAWAVRHDAHIRIEYLYLKAGSDARRVLQVIAAGATLLIFLVLAVMVARAGLGEFDYGELSPGLGAPRWWYTVWIAPLALWVVVRSLQALLRAAAGNPEKRGC